MQKESFLFCFFKVIIIFFSGREVKHEICATIHPSWDVDRGREAEDSCSTGGQQGDAEYSSQAGGGGGGWLMP